MQARGLACRNRSSATQFTSRVRPQRVTKPVLLAPRPSSRFAAQVVRAAASSEVQKDLDVQSLKIDKNVLQKTEAAIERLGFRVTVGDVAAAAGLKLEEADDALKALAFDSLGALEVSQQGDVVYSFNRNFRSAINSKSFWLRTRPAVDKARKAGNYLVRVLFGTSLVASVVTVGVAITLLLSAKSDDDRRGGRQQDQGRGGYGGGYSRGYSGGGFQFLNMADLFYYWSPRYYVNSQEKIRSGQSLTFLESVFSFVFGDGDPNEQFPDMRWAALGQMITAKGGVVTAEEMAPYLDVPQRAADAGTFPDEGYVLPALLKFGGEPEVDEQGNLLYVFPRLQRSADARNMSSSTRFDVALEKEAPFTAATSGQVLGTVALGVINVLGVAFLTNLLSDPQMRYTAVYNGLGWIPKALPWFQAYAAAFFAIPTIRWFWHESKNRAVALRNELRARAVDFLNAGNDRRLQAKLASARAKGQRTVLNKRDVVYDTSAPTAAQLGGESELSDWDSRFEKDRRYAPAAVPTDRRPNPAKYDIYR